MSTKKRKELDEYLKSFKEGNNKNGYDSGSPFTDTFLEEQLEEPCVDEEPGDEER